MGEFFRAAKYAVCGTMAATAATIVLGIGVPVGMVYLVAPDVVAQDGGLVGTAKKVEDYGINQPEGRVLFDVALVGGALIGFTSGLGCYRNTRRREKAASGTQPC